MRDEHQWFLQGVKAAKTWFPWLLKNNKRTQQKVQRYFPPSYQEILTFTGLDVEPYDILLFAYTGAFLSFCIFFVCDLFVVFSYGISLENLDMLTIVLMATVLLLIPFVVMNIIAKYPKTLSKYVQIHSLGDVPELLSYLVMYLKLVPNLENSVKFAASESSTTLAHDLRKLVWDMEIRVYHGIDDAITAFATYWGRWSEYFKRSLHLIRSSLQEREEASRIITLDRALDVSLEGTKETMNQYANKLHQPTMILYSLGIMIPLSLVAMLPAAGLVGMKITIFQIFFVYNILLPLFVFLYIRKILLSRPATFNLPRLPSDHPDFIVINKHRLALIALLAGTLVMIPGVIFLLIPIVIPTGSSQPVLSFISDIHGLNSYMPVTLFFIWGVTTMIAVYTLKVYCPYKKVRDDIKHIENEFSDALYILAKRISEEKSPEDSFLYTSQTMEGSQIAEVFRKTSYNLSAMHTNLRDALFSTEFGSLRYVYSDRIKALLKLFVEGTQKSQRAMSASLIRIADHLKQLQEVEQKIKDMLYELTSTMRSTITVFAPVIAGVTLAITTLISSILASLQGTFPVDATAGLSPTLSTVSDAFTMENIRPEYFVLVIGIYLIELVVLLSRFINGINEGDDNVCYMYSLGKTLPTSILVFSLTILLGQFFFSQFITLS